VRTGRRLAILAEGTGPIRGVEYSPGGRVLVTLGADRTVRLWDVPTRRELFVLYRHDAPLRWATFDPPGRLLVGADGRDGRSGEVLAFPPLAP
jgi:WD40 repeat protein